MASTGLNMERSTSGGAERGPDRNNAAHPQMNTDAASLEPPRGMLPGWPLVSACDTLSRESSHSTPDCELQNGELRNRYCFKLLGLG